MRLLTVPGVFRPRSDSRLLAAHVGERARPHSSFLDPFTGSGILAIAAAAAGARATAIDVSHRAVACATLNARLSGVRVRALCGDMFEPVRRERFDLIAANPPYLPAASAAPPRGAARAWDAGPDGRDLLDRFCAEVGDHLSPGGRLLLTHSSICDPARTEAILTDAGLEVGVAARVRGRLGPLLASRATLLEQRGLIEAGEHEEEIIVFEALHPADSEPGRRVGTVG